jgi:hypothetical protein
MTSSTPERGHFHLHSSSGEFLMVPFHITDRNITFIANGKPYMVNHDHPNFTTIRHELLSGSLDFGILIELADIPLHIKTQTKGKISVDPFTQQVFYKAEPLHNVWVDKIFNFLKNDLPVDPIVLALESLMRNPSFQARERLPLFQQHNELGFLPDGRLVGLKAVRHDFKDKWKGTFDNTPGNICRMERSQISDDPSVHCAPGLHVGSWAYVSNYASSSDDKIITVAFWPEHVVAVPLDIQTKIRVEEYESLSVLHRSAVDIFIRNNENIVVTNSNTQGPEIDDLDDGGPYYG